jgi:transcriptional regulator NrdR family protein
MKGFSFSILIIIFFSSCNDQGRTAGKVPFDTVPKAVAFNMVRHYLDTAHVSHSLDSIIKFIKVGKDTLDALLTKDVVSLKFITAADLNTNFITVLIQQKLKKGNDSSYVYYDMRSPSPKKVTNFDGICPLPNDCANSIEQ